MLFISVIKWAIGISLTIISAVIFFLSYPFSKEKEFLHKLAALWARSIIIVSGSEVIVHGMNNLENIAGPRVVFANHQSFFDIYILTAWLPGKVIFLSKDSIFKIPILGLIMKILGQVSIKRTDARSALRSMDEAAERVREGYLLVVFPEGTRSKNGKVAPFKSGVARIPYKAEARIIPVVISGTGNIQKKGSMKVKGSKIKISILPSISPPGRSKREQLARLEEVREKITSSLYSNR
jgi:1-acyl-sn-glycerol-3-phosphate acyltransferase